MSRFNKLLLATLSLQLIIAAGLLFERHSATAQPARVALFDVDRFEVDRITLVEDGKETELKRQAGQWRLASEGQLPANSDKVKAILEKLTTTPSGYPVATTAASRQRFEVADDHFQKKVVLYSGEKELGALYLGTSPGFRQLHVRRAGEDEVYNVKLNSHDLPIRADEWLDKQLLQPQGEIVALEGPDFDFEKNGAQWQPRQGEGEVDEQALTELTSSLARLKVLKMAEAQPTDSAYTLTLKTGERDYAYRFFKVDDNFFVSRDDIDRPFQINKSDYDRITGQTRQQLVKRQIEEIQQDVADQPAGTGAPEGADHS